MTNFAKTLNEIKVENKLADVDVLAEEISKYYNVLLGREEVDSVHQYSYIIEVATAYYVRAKEIEGAIHKLERQLVVTKNSQYYKFRTGELRSFIEACSKMIAYGQAKIDERKILEAI